MAGETTENPEPVDDFTEPLPWWSRLLAVVLGTCAGGLGTLAVFKTDNQAGTAFLLVLSAALLLIGLQGSPLIKLGSGDSSIQLARIRGRVTKELVKAVQDDRPEVSQAVVEAVESIAPDLVSPALLGRRYQSQVEASIARIDPSLVIAENDWDQGADLTVHKVIGMSRTAVAVDVKYLGRAKLSMADIQVSEHRVAGSVLADRLVVVTNARPTNGASAYLVERNSDSSHVQLVVWNGPRDDSALALALSRQMQPRNANES